MSDHKSQTPANGEELNDEALESVAGGASTPLFPPAPSPTYPVSTDPVIGPISPEPLVPLDPSVTPS